jgi:hypothetical protein
MNLLRRIERLEKLRADMPDKSLIITHDEFLTLTLAEIALRHPIVDGIPVDIKGADRIERIRHHPQKTVDYSAHFAISASKRAEHTTTIMIPRILALQAAYDTGDHTVYWKQRAKDKKTLLGKALLIVERLEAKIG